ncbi:MAG: threonine--tRNA ligase [Candidatus Paceibacterota bacterium]|jgi:threonyl-tRNA synthetase
MSKKEAEKDQMYKVRHSLCHLMSSAIMELYPKAGLGVGPAIEDGFYQDYDLPETINESILPKLEKRVRELIKEKIAFVQHRMGFDEARKLYKDDPYKTELINELEKSGEKDVSFFKSGNFDNLCLGPHVKTTVEIDPTAFKLTRIAGAYWRGDSKNKMLTRIYGVAFENKEKLDAYLNMLKEAEKRDHRKLGKEMDLFTFSEYIGSGLPLYTPRGALIRRLLNEYIESLQSKVGYTQVWTPQIAKAELFKISGHYDKYKDDMFKVSSNYSEEEFFLKPMNCPQHTQIYKSQMRSYRDLPLRYTDFAMLYRDEKPGELNGLARVRSFSQDDCHVFCREDQVDEEIDLALNMTKEAMATFGFKYKYRLSTRDPKHPEKYCGDPKTWDKVEAWAEKIMKRHNIEYFDGPGEAAFYAPKMDLIATDALGRDWQLSTVQIDFVMPERFGLSYIDNDGKEKRPVMIHRAIIGSPERFIMVLLEHYAGALPTWLFPNQVQILPISQKFSDYANQVANKLKERSVRVTIDNSDETLGKKIREAKKSKVPYIIVVGEKEQTGKTITAEKRGGESLKDLKIEEFIDLITEEIASKAKYK